MYRLIVHSKPASAEKFERWLFEEVLPSIRKHGAYMTPETLEAAILNPDVLIRLCQSLKEERDQRRALEDEKNADPLIQLTMTMNKAFLDIIARLEAIEDPISKQERKPRKPAVY